MKKHLSKRWLLSGLTAGLLFLAFSVFAWGLHYKLSLYQHLDGSSDVPAAKLLSGADKSAAGLVVAQRIQHQRLADVSLLSAFAFVFVWSRDSSRILTILWRRLLTGSLSKFRASLGLHPFFFRPPPSFI